MNRSLGLEVWLRESGLAWSPGELLATSAASGLGAGLLGMGAGWSAWVVVVVAWAASFLPIWLASRLRMARRRALERAAPDLLERLSRLLPVRRNVVLAFESLAPDLPWPLRQEVDRLLALVRLGRSPVAVLREMGERLPSAVYRRLAEVAALAVESGVDPVPLFDQVARDMRARRVLRAEHLAATNAFQWMARLFVALQALVFVWGYSRSPDDRRFFQSKAGRRVVVFSAGATGLSFLAIQWAGRLEP